MSSAYKPKRFDSFRRFLSEYRRSKLGVAGVVIIIFFAVLAASAPSLTPYNPIRSTELSGHYSIPSWARSLPQYANYPVDAVLVKGTQFATNSELASWRLGSLPSANDSSKGFASYASIAEGLSVNFTKGTATSNPFAILSQAVNPTITINQTVSYPWTFPCEFTAGISITPLGGNLSTSELLLNIYIRGVGGQVFHVMSPDIYTNPLDIYTYFSEFKVGTTYRFDADNHDINLEQLATTSSRVQTLRLGCEAAEAIFAHAGSVTISYVISSTVSTRVRVSGAFFFVQGSAFGLMGTDDQGRDVWSQFVYGGRISLEVGLAAAVLAVVIGTAVGLAAGFLGGLVDESLMRFNDFLLTLPFLPLVLVLLSLVNLSHLTNVLSTETMILLLLALLGWNGIARIIRAQVLSVKARQFVEASRALGAKDRHIIWKHILPNVMGLVYANMAISVPTFILTEAALTFIGFGDPSVISWGTMLSNALGAVTSQAHSFVWWWFLPPGVSIAVLSMAFVFVGFSLDSVLNPRLRER